MIQRRIVFANRKGGCGKTSSVVNVAAGLALADRKVLLIDCDSQSHASIHLGFSQYETEISLYDLLTDNIDCIDDVIYEAKWPKGLYIIPATGQLNALELEMSNNQNMKFSLAKKLMVKETSHFNYILFDTPPTVGLLNIMCLIAAKEAIIPVQTHFLSMEGLAEMVRYIYQINATVNAELKIAGIIPTFFNRKAGLSKEVVKEIKKNFGTDIVFPVVRHNNNIAEAPGFGQCIFKYAPHSIGAIDYTAIIERIDSNKLVNPLLCDVGGRRIPSKNSRNAAGRKKKKKKKRR